MKHIFIMALLCIAVSSCNRKAMPSDTPIINSTILNENNQPILVGHCSPQVLQTSPYDKWFTKNYNDYTVDTATVHMLQPFLKNKTMEIFLGSWCGDSKEEVPKMLKILSVAGFDTASLQLIFVDNSTHTYKQSPQHEEAGKNIHHVPTFIIYDKKNAVGRIIETPVVSLEMDLLAVLAKENYIPKYRAIAWWQQNVKYRDKDLNEPQLRVLAGKLKPLCLHKGEFNAYGYVLLAQKNYAEAMNIFMLNTFIYPGSPDVYDSLGEAFMTIGNKQEAIKNYKKVLELKPGDENAMKMLDKLK